MDKSVSNFNTRLRTIRLRELLVVLVISTIIIIVASDIFPAIEQSDDLFFIAFLSIVGLSFIWFLRGTTGLADDFKMIFKPGTRNEILYVFLINIIFAFLFLCLISTFDILIGLYDPTWIVGFDMDKVDLSAGAFLISAIGTIIFAPIIEELVFRGVLFNRLKIRIGIIPAMLISSFLFAMGHSFGGMTSAFLFGICMCILYLKTDNIIVPMSVHFINNLVSTILDFTSIDAIVSQMPWLAIATIITLISTVLLIKYIIQETSILKNKFEN